MVPTLKRNFVAGAALFCIIVRLTSEVLLNRSTLFLVKDSKTDYYSGCSGPETPRPPSRRQK